MKKIFLGGLLSFILILIGGGVALIGVHFSPPVQAHSVIDNSASSLAEKYGVDQRVVVDLARRLEVDPEKIGTLGPDDFPLNYYQRQFRLFEKEHGRPPRRSEVEAMMEGYVAECEITSSKLAYFYYSSKTHRSVFEDEIAMLFFVDFEFPVPEGADSGDLLLTGVRFFDLLDGSLNPPDETYWEKCVNDYAAAHQEETER